MNTLQKALQEYLAMRRALGFQLLDAGPALSDFVSFLKRRRTCHITIRLALEWAQKPGAQPARWAHRLGFVRGFARYRSATDPRTEIPPWRLLPFRSKRARPYLYTDDEVRALLKASLGLSPNNPLRKWTYHGLLGLLAVSGLRLSEVLSLRMSDVDLQNAVLTVRGTKFGKCRLVPFTVRREGCCRCTSRVETSTAKANRPLTFSSLPQEELGWTRTTSAERSMLCRGRPAFGGSSIAVDLACTTFVIDSPFKHFCVGIARATMSNGVFRFFPPISDTSVQTIPIGI